MTKKPNLLENAFDEEKFREKGHQLVDQLAELLKSSKKRGEKVTEPQKPDELLAFWKGYQADSTNDLFQKIIDQSINLFHPRYVGHQVAAPTPLSALSNLLSGFLNNGMGIYEMGEGPTAIEKAVVDMFCEHIGYSDGDGVLTSGGTLANLTGLLAARAHYRKKNIWNEGTSEQYCVMVSEMAHYCVDRAVRIMGWGEEGIIKVPVDDRYRMKTDLLVPLLEKAEKENKKVLAIVGSAPSTGTGSYDNLQSIAHFCESKNIWFHVDGAHGGPAIFSEKYNSLMKGSERADSVVIDAHKMMLSPALTTALLFKRRGDSYQTFSQDAFYLWEGQKDKEWYNIAKRTFECTKVMMAIRILTNVQEYGTSLFDEFITRQYDLARAFASEIKESHDFLLATEPDSNIVCFKYVPPDSNLTESEITDLNRNLRKRIFELGQFYLVQTVLKDGLYLRISLMNPLTTMNDLRDMLEHIREQAGML